MQTHFFLHIPKCGGSTLRTVAERQYKSRDTLDLYDTFYLEQRKAEQQVRQHLAKGGPGRRVLIAGHMGFGLHRSLDSDEYLYFTLLRQPAKRVASLYRDQATQPRALLHEAITRGELDFRGFLFDSEWLDLDNGMTRRLADPKIAAERPFGSADVILYQSALKNLMNPKLICGVVSSFDLSLLLLGDRLGWTKSIHYYKERRTSPALLPEIPHDLRCRVEELSEWDSKLYQQACAKLELSLGGEGELLEQRVEELARSNRGLKRLIVAPGLARVKSVRLAHGAVRRTRKRLARGTTDSR